MGKSKAVLRSFGFYFVIMAIMLSFSCIAAIPLVIEYEKSKKGYVSKVEVPAPADKVYQTALREAEARHKLKILKKDDTERLIEITDGVQKASVKATPAGPEKTDLEIVADIPKTEEGKEVEVEREKELSLRIVNVLCDALGVKCTVAEK
jgi:hypothetical protein